MKILIDGYGLLAGEKGAGGAGKYLVSLLQGLGATDHSVRVIASLDNHRLFAGIAHADVQVVARLDEWTLLSHFQWADVFYAPLNGLRPALLPHELPVVVCIHDLQHKYAPQFFAGDVRKARDRDYGFAIGRAKRVIAISNFEKENIRMFFGRTAVDVVHHGGYLAEQYDEAGDTRLREQGVVPAGDYILYPAVAWPHKNHLRLVQAFALATRAGLRCRLVLTGALEHEFSRPDFLQAAQDFGLTEDIFTVRGFVPDEELAVLIRNARALVFPSLYEGFGIPLVEAMKLGVPVIASRATAIPEVLEDAGAYFADCENPVAMARDLVRYLGDSELLSEKSRLGLMRSRSFSIQKMCRETVAVFECAIAERASPGTSSVANASGEVDKPVEEPSVAALLVVSSNDIAGGVLSLDGLCGRMRLTQSDTYLFLPIDADDRNLRRAESLVAGTGAKVCLYDEGRSESLTQAIRFIHKSALRSDYVIIERLTDETFRPLQLRNAVAELNYLTDCDAAFVDKENRSVLPVVVPPGNDEEVFKAFLACRDAPMSLFWGWLLRRRLFDAADVPGTVRFLSFFLKKVSYLSLPPLP